MRGLGAAAVWARAVPAGIMASSNGRPMLTPTPLMTVLRERCFFVMNMGYFLYGASTPISLRGPCPDISTGPLPRHLYGAPAPTSLRGPCPDISTGPCPELFSGIALRATR